MSNQTWRNAINNNPIQQSIRQFLAKFPLKIHRSLYAARELDVPRLYTWGPGWKSGQQTSFDQECVKWQTLLKFSKSDFETKSLNEPLMSPSGKLPFLVLTTGDVLVDDAIEKHVTDMYSENLGSLNNEQQEADSAAYIASADTKLRNALLYNLWCEPANESITYNKYVGHYAKPLDKLLFHKYKSLAVRELLTRKPVLDKEEIYQEANEALQAISIALGDSKYFFGSSLPTFIDAVVFSYIHVILNIPLNELVQVQSNLVKYSERIYNEYILSGF
ncbi:hypothetical protein RclHR1_04590003 [Rhizophagus clarus]|uniref:Metaxin glutathione S-transferase domain-containing protein n=1 Tax=Rhizophagus clarus TaxID=94130 RepID=A0A2Z6RZP2_9GLOM|nr:hypothetical protein RclHR1_04590003 [Rhizophagus clarus]